MRKNNIRNIILVLVIALLSFACLTSSKTREKLPENNSSSEPVVSDAEEYIYDEGGFKFTPIPDWEITCAIGIIQMASPDADSDFGPMFLIMAGDNQDEMSTDEAFSKFEESSTGSDVSKPKKVKVGGFQGLQADLTSQQGDIEIKARVITSMLLPTRQFTMMASSPADRWKDEVEPYFEDVVSSIKFIDIVPDAGCPNTGHTSDPDPSAETMLDEPVTIPEEVTELRQWASSARASSEYGETSWSASQATGEPNVDECGDNSNAWASKQSNTKDWIELTYDVPVVPTEIAIYMSYNPSQIVEVDIIDVDGNEYIAREVNPEKVDFCPDLYQVFLELDDMIYINKVKIHVDQTQLKLGWTEIDAVELIGYPEGGQITAAQPSKPQTSPGESQGETTSPYSPQELDPGAYTYAVTGYENDVVMGANVQYQSNDTTYVVALISGDERYIVNLMLPKNKLKSGIIPMQPYSLSAVQKDLTATIYINAFLYIADSGEYNFETDPSTGKLTGTFTFKAHSKDYPDRLIEVAGAVNAVPVK